MIRGGSGTLQADLETFSHRARSWNLHLNTGKCVFMRFGTGSPCDMPVGYSLYGQNLTQVEAHKDLGVLVDTNLKFHLHVGSLVRKANGVANQLLKATVCRSAKFMVTLFVSHIRPLLDFSARLWNVGYLGDVRKLEMVQISWVKEISGMRALPYTECLKSLELFSVYGRMVRGDLIKIWQAFHPVVDIVGLRNLLDTQTHSATRSNGYKLAVPRCRLELHRRFWSVRCVQRWNSLPAEVVQAPSLESFKRRLDAHLSELLFETIDD